ncbi:hypothetical protein Bca4012_043666 [Brassica carinata]
MTQEELHAEHKQVTPCHHDVQISPKKRDHILIDVSAPSYDFLRHPKMAHRSKIYMICSSKIQSISTKAQQHLLVSKLIMFAGKLARTIKKITVSQPGTFDLCQILARRITATTCRILTQLTFAESSARMISLQIKRQRENLNLSRLKELRQRLDKYKGSR